MEEEAVKTGEEQEVASPLIDKLGQGWYDRLGGFMQSGSQMARGGRLGSIRKSTIVFPDIEDTFRAFKLTPFEQVKVVILGQDPYHDGQANGLAFSTKGRLNPSLKKINEGMEDDLALGEFLDPIKRYDWEYLARQGVLLLNAALTVERGRPNSHLSLWEPFTLQVLDALAYHPDPLVFLLWGASAQSLVKRAAVDNHNIMMTEHPAYAARQGRLWEHNKCFSKTNEYLISKGIPKIRW